MVGFRDCLCMSVCKENTNRGRRLAVHMEERLCKAQISEWNYVGNCVS